MRSISVMKAARMSSVLRAFEGYPLSVFSLGRIHARPMAPYRRKSALSRSRHGHATSPAEHATYEKGNVVRLEHLPAALTVDSVASVVRRQWRRLLFGGLAALLCSVSNIAAPVFMGVLFEFLVVGTPVQQYMHVLALFCCAYVLEPILSQYYMRNFIGAGERVLAEVRREVFDRLLHEEVSFFDQRRTAEFTNVLSVELDTLRNFVFSNVTRDRGLRSILEVIGVILVLFAMSWRLAPILSGVILVTAASASWYKRRTKPAEEAQFQALEDMVSVADQAIRHIRTVRSFGGENIECTRFNESVQQSLHHGLIFGGAKANTESLNRGAVHLSLLVLFWYGGHLVRHGLLPYRVLVAAIGYVFSLVYASQGVISTIVDYRKARGALARVWNLLSATHPVPTPKKFIIVRKPVPEESVENGRPRTRVAAAHGDLILQDIGFAYPMRPDSRVLRSLKLELLRGTVTALVGQSGSGKSTVSALLCRFYEPDSGQILLNDIPANQFDRKDWNSAVALVSQDPVLFRGTVYENICYGRRSGASMHDVVQVAKSANAHEFIQNLPEGYHTRVGEKGLQLSGGEKQRIAIARALLKDAPIVLLDEPTSSLDLMGEAKVQEALDRLMIGRTVMVIAHRLSTIKSASTIAVLKNGSVVEKGTHAELLMLNGHYAKLIRSKNL